MNSLTIAIPTYNRPQSLLRLLDIIKLEIAELRTPGLLDVIVCDNSDTYETRDTLLSSEFAEVPWLNYRKNESNVGFDANILNLFCEAKGDYVWLVGDDDIIFKGSIEKVIELIELNPDILHLPFRQPQNLQVPQYQQAPRIKYWTTAKDAIRQILKYIKITSFVYKRKVSVDRENLKRVFGRSGWMHLVIGFEVLLNSERITSITLSEFFAGSLDAEWKSVDWTPAASLMASTLSRHEIIGKFHLKEQLEEFEHGMYLGGIQMTFMVTSGSLATRLPINEYFDFGANYPFRWSLLLNPSWLLKYTIVKLGIGPGFSRLQKLFQRFRSADIQGPSIN